MSKTLTIAFTGSVLLTPEFPNELVPISGPLYAVMPGARRMRRSTFRNDQIDAQFGFIKFALGHHILKNEDDRAPDYKHPVRAPETGICFLECEELWIETLPDDKLLTFDTSPCVGFPTNASTGVRWAPRWQDFTGSRAAFQPDVLNTRGRDLVRLSVPAGHISTRFPHEPISRLNFDYGFVPETRPYAQEIVITLSYPDETPYVTLRTIPFHENAPGGPTQLRFEWHDARNIDLVVGNGTLESILNLLSGSFVGHDHEGDYDIDFEVTYDVITVVADQNERFPLPRIVSSEILRVPCAASMISAPPQLPPTGPETASTIERAERIGSRRKP